jgi:putative IMPACT (imprinted ancient) family translation regulator
MYLSIKEAMLLKSENDVREQIELRRKQISDMVGWLYPSIINGEIEKLIKRIHDIRNPVGNFQI